MNNPTETAKALLAKLEAMPSEGNIRLVVEVILAERRRCAAIFKDSTEALKRRLREEIYKL